MIRIAISQAAFEAIARTLPLGSVSFENKISGCGSVEAVNGVAGLSSSRPSTRPRP
jgi:hypothetical protein